MGLLKIQIIRRLWVLVVVFFGLSIVRAEDTNQLSVQDFSPGLITEENFLHIPDGAAKNLLNVDVEDRTVQKRTGSILINFSTFTPSGVRVIDSFIQGSSVTWFIAVAGTQTYKSNSYGATWSVLSSTHGPKNSTGQLGYGSAFGKWWLGDGTTYWMNFDGDVVNFSTVPPFGITFVFAYQRMFTSSGTNVCASAVDNPYDWTDDGLLDVDAFCQPIDPNDGEIVKSLVVWAGRVFIFKPHSIHAIYFPDNVNPTFQTLTKAYGSDHPYTIQAVGDGIIFLFNDGWYKYTDAGITKLSDQINPTVRGIRQLQGGTNTESEDAVFNGSFTLTSAQLFSGSIRLSTFTRTDTNQDNWSGGTFTRTTVTANGILQFDTVNNNQLVVDHSFEDNLAVLSGASRISSTTAGFDAKDGQWMVKLDGLETLPVGFGQEGNGHFFIFSTTTISATTTWTLINRTIISSYIGLHTQTQFSIETNSSNNIFIIHVTTSIFISRQAPYGFGFWYRTKANGSQYEIYVDSITDYLTFHTTSSYTSAVYDTSVSSGHFMYAFAGDGGAVIPSGCTTTITLEGSTAAVGGFSTIVSSTIFKASSFIQPVTTITFNNHRYVRYSIDYSTYTDVAFFNGQIPILDEISLYKKAYQGFYVSSAIIPGVTYNFGAVVVDFTVPKFQTVGESNTVFPSSTNSSYFGVYIDTDSTTTFDPYTLSTFQSSQTIANGQLPILSSSANDVIYFVFHASASNILHNPQLNSWALSYFSANTNFAKSLFYKQKYYCALSTGSNTLKDIVFVLDRNYAWTIYNGWTVGDFMDYFDTPYFVDGSIGKLYKFEQPGIYADDGVAYQSYWESKGFDFGFPLQNKTHDKFGFYTDRTVGTTLNIQYGIDFSSLTVKTADLGSKSGYYSEVVRPVSTLYKTGRVFSVKFENNVINQFWRVLGFLLFPRLETSQ